MIMRDLSLLVITALSFPCLGQFSSLISSRLVPLNPAFQLNPTKSSPKPMCIPRAETLTIFEQEERVLAFSGLQLQKELFVYDVPIQIQGKEYKIHTYRCGDNNPESLVLIHGYGGSSVLYYPMLKDLSSRFRVYCLDIIGMGLSSREEFTCKSTEETLGFLMESIEKWREAVGLNRFYLVGHSLGGYLSGYYTAKYQQHVIKLILLSPVGITKYEPEPSIQEIKKKIGFFRGFFLGLFVKVFKNRMTPSKFIKSHPTLGKWLIKNYVYRRFRLKGAEAEALKDLMISMMNLPEGSADAVHYILKPPMGNAVIPLEDNIVNDIQVPVDCFYGEMDYMDTTGGKRIQYMKDKSEYCFKIVPKAAHQLTMQNPKFLSQDIIQNALTFEKNIVSNKLAFV